VNLPIFPLNTVLFPQGIIPLQVFEVRYLNMVQRCEKEGTPFIVACLHDGDEIQRPDPTGEETYQQERFHHTGTLAHIEHVAVVKPGLLRIICRGGERVRIDRCEKGPLGLWVGDTAMIHQDKRVTIPSELSHISDALSDVLGRLYQEYPDAMGVSQPPEHGAPEWENAGWVANRWAELLPLPNDLKLRLLTIESPLIRLELIGDQLDEMGLSY
jgi:Lon protease-like protein